MGDELNGDNLSEIYVSSSQGCIRVVRATLTLVHSLFIICYLSAFYQRGRLMDNLVNNGCAPELDLLEIVSKVTLKE